LETKSFEAITCTDTEHVSLQNTQVDVGIFIMFTHFTGVEALLFSMFQRLDK